MLNRYTCLLLLFTVCNLFMACHKDEDADLSDEGTNQWIYRIMESYYLWYNDLPAKDKLNYSKDPEQFFTDLISDQDGVDFQNQRLVFSSIEKKQEATKSIDESNSYGFQYATAQMNGGFYYAWVLYVLPGSPAADAGLKRGDWIVAIGADQPNIKSSAAFNSGAATTFLIAKYTGGEFVYDRTLSVPMSRAVEDNPFLMDSVYHINGKTIGYLAYSSFASGPDNKTEAYNNQMKQLFVQFKAEQVSEFVLDLRYNPGGLASCAQLLTSFLAPAESLGKTFCTLEYNDKHTSENKTLLLYRNSEIQNANLDLNRIYILTGATTASASEAVINGLIPHMGRTNITLIGEKTIGKNVGSNSFGESESYDYLLHPITLRIYNAAGSTDYANGFTPDVAISELVLSNTLLPLGDPQELLFSEALRQITGQTSFRSLPVTKESSVVFSLPKIARKKIQGFIN